MKKIAAFLTILLSLSLLPAIPATAAPAQQATRAASSKITKVSFSVKTVHGKHRLSVKANVKATSKKQPLVIRDAKTKRKIISCTTVAKCATYLPKKTAAVYATSGKYRSTSFQVIKPTLTKVRLVASRKDNRLYLSVSGNVQTLPAKTSLIVRDAKKKTVLSKCTTVIKCSRFLPSTTTSVYATWGTHRTAVVSTSNIVATNDDRLQQIFGGITLSARHPTISSPAYYSSDRTTGISSNYTEDNGGFKSSPVSTGTDILTITGIPAYSEFKKYGLALYLYEVNDRDSTIGEATLEGDGHLNFISDPNGNPTFTLYAWNGDRSHTYVAAVGPETRGTVTNSANQHRQHPFAYFMTDQYPNAENPNVDYIGLSNPVTIKPVSDWHLELETVEIGAPWAKSNVTTFSNLAPGQLQPAALFGDPGYQLTLWDNWYGDQTQKLAEVREKLQGSPGGQNSSEYPNADSIMDYGIYALDHTTGQWIEQMVDANADAYYDDAAQTMVGQGGSLDPTHSYSFVIARRLGNTVFDIRAGTKASTPSGATAAPQGFNCTDPATQTTPVGDKWDMTQTKYAIADALTNGAATRLDMGLGVGLVNPCSFEYKFTGAAITAAQIAYPVGKLSDVGEVANFERAYYNKALKYGTLISKISDTSNITEVKEVITDSIKEELKDTIKERAEEQAKEVGYDLANKYFAAHGIAVRLSADKDGDSDS